METELWWSYLKNWLNIDIWLVKYNDTYRAYCRFGNDNYLDDDHIERI